MLYETGKLVQSQPADLTSTAGIWHSRRHECRQRNRRTAHTQLPANPNLKSADKISGEAITDTILVKNQACWACPITCTRITKTASGKEGEGPEFESAWAFGAQCGIDDLDAITEANFLCNDMGIDTISMGNTIGCAMELAEKGLIDSDLRFGNATSLLELISDTAYRRGLGDDMAEGSYRMAEKYGAPQLSMTSRNWKCPPMIHAACRGRVWFTPPRTAALAMKRAICWARKCWRCLV